MAISTTLSEVLDLYEQATTIFEYARDEGPNDDETSIQLHKASMIMNDGVVKSSKLEGPEAERATKARQRVMRLCDEATEAVAERPRSHTKLDEVGEVDEDEPE